MVYNESKGGWVAGIIQFFAWIIASIAAIADALAIREALLSLAAVFRVMETAAYHARGGVGEDIITAFGITAFDSVMLLILACGGIVATIAIEYYFRKGRPQGLLYKRIGKVLGIEAGIIVLAFIIRTLVATFI